VLIDWFTVAAQIVNFLILVALLKRFLYRPIVRAMDAREAGIASLMEEAQATQKAAAQERDAFHGKMAEFESRREAYLAQAREEAESQQTELLQEVRAEIEQSRARWYQSIHQEQGELLREIRGRAGKLVFSTVRRALADLAEADLEQQVIRQFLHRLKADGAAVLLHSQGADTAGGKPVLVRTAFEVQPEARQDILDEIQPHLPDGVEVTFETDPGLVCGIELRLQGRKIEWHLEEYLDALEESALQALTEEVGEPDGHETPAADGAAV
jgi:F-type H+-transporting ATPase subunit b